MTTMFTSAITEGNEKIDVLTEQLKNAKDRLNKLEKGIENNDSYKRRDTSVLSGSKIPAPLLQPKIKIFSNRVAFLTDKT